MPFSHALKVKSLLCFDAFCSLTSGYSSFAFMRVSTSHHRAQVDS
jgi:hypothetical protein